MMVVEVEYELYCSRDVVVVDLMVTEPPTDLLVAVNRTVGYP
jgi:hypothetical protein